MVVLRQVSDELKFFVVREMSSRIIWLAIWWQWSEAENQNSAMAHTNDAFETKRTSWRKENNKTSKLEFSLPRGRQKEGNFYTYQIVELFLIKNVDDFGEIAILNLVLESDRIEQSRKR